MKIVIIGDGRVGHKLAVQLSEEDYDITNHLVYEQAVERKIISPLEDKIDQVKTLRERGKSEMILNS